MSVPKIDEHEARNLEMIFGAFEDKQLIRELVRRGRLHVVDCSELFHTELKDNDEYMASINHRIRSAIVRELDDKGHVLIQDRRPPSHIADKQTWRRGTLIVLRERGAKRDDL